MGQGCQWRGARHARAKRQHWAECGAGHWVAVSGPRAEGKRRRVDWAAERRGRGLGSAGLGWSGLLFFLFPFLIQTLLKSN